MRVWDPAQPGVAVQTVKLVMSNGILWAGSHLLFSDATRYDPSTRTVTTALPLFVESKASSADESVHSFAFFGSEEISPDSSSCLS